MLIRRIWIPLLSLSFLGWFSVEAAAWEESTIFFFVDKKDNANVSNKYFSIQNAQNYKALTTGENLALNMAHADGIYNAEANNNTFTVSGTGYKIASGKQTTGTHIYAAYAHLKAPEGQVDAGDDIYEAKAVNNKLYIKNLTTDTINNIQGLAIAGNADNDPGYVGNKTVAAGNLVEVSEGSLLYMRVLAAQCSPAAEDSIVIAELNKAIIKDSKVLGSVYGVELSGTVGGEKGIAAANNNAVSIENSYIGTEKCVEYIYGAGGDAKEINSAAGNTVTIRNSTTYGYFKSIYEASKICGVSIVTSEGINDAGDNHVIISGSTIGDGYVAGSILNSANNSGREITEQGSSVMITASTVSSYVYGTQLIASKGNVRALSGDTPAVTVKDSKLSKSVYGAYSCVTTSGNAQTEGHSVLVKGSSINARVYGSLSQTTTGDAKTKGHTVTVEDSKVSSYVYGAYSYVTDSGNAQSEGHTVTVKDSSELSSYVCGAYSYVTNSGNAQTKGHTVTVEDSAVSGNVYGGRSRTATGDAKSNGHTVTVEDSIIKGAIYGADSYVNTKGSAAASNNTVSLKGGTYKDSIYGARANAQGEGYKALSQNNTIVLAQGKNGSSPVFDEDKSVVWGSYAAVSGKTDKSWTSGNTIQFDHVKGMTAANLKNVSTLDYQLPHMRAGEAVLTLKDAGFEKTDISDASVHVAVFSIEGGDGGEFREGERIILLQNRNKDGLITDGIKKEPVTAQQGISLKYDLLMETDDKTLYLTRKRMTIAPESKSVPEGWLAGLGLITQAANMADDLSIRLNEEGWLPFAYMKGGSMRYNTGSHIDMNSLSLIAGIGRGVRADSGLFIVGGFFEYGTGAYRTHNSFASRSFDGDGNAWYMGAGLLASMDFNNTGPGHFYLEGSGHMGSLHNYYNNDDLRGLDGRSASFETDTPYYAVHLGLGYIWDIDDESTLDLYGRYFWARIDGTEETLTTGDPIVFDDAVSVRTRLGAKYSRKVNEHLNAYIGAAWEHEFAGDSDSRAYGHDLASPSLRGDSARGELGIELVPSKELPLTVNFGVQGWLGQKEGVTGSCFVQYAF